MLAMLPSNVNVGLFHFIASSILSSTPRIADRTWSIVSFSGWSRAPNQASTSGSAPTSTPAFTSTYGADPERPGPRSPGGRDEVVDAFGRGDERHPHAEVERHPQILFGDARELADHLDHGRHRPGSPVDPGGEAL